MRAMDDKIIYKLNTTVPTKSFSGQISAADQCKLLYEEMSHVYTKRQNAIKKCVDENLTQVQSLKAQRDSAEDDPQLKKQLRKRQTVLHVMQSELGVEDVVKERSVKVFKERCWQAYKPPDL
jgi:hypothetical protein